MKRTALIQILIERILGVTCSHPVRVAIDGVDGVGKTYLANEIAESLRKSRQVIRASVDEFHNPRSVRYRLGRHSAEGYFRDSFNYLALETVLLDPLSPGATRRYRRAVFDYRIEGDNAFRNSE